MIFHYDKDNCYSLKNQTFLNTNGRGGYCSLSVGHSVTRCDQGVLIASVKSPNKRITLVHRLKEILETDNKKYFLSAQRLAGYDFESGEQNLISADFNKIAYSDYKVNGIRIKSQITIEYGRNTTALVYYIENSSESICKFSIHPMMKFAPKENVRDVECEVTYSEEENKISADGYNVYISTNGKIYYYNTEWENLFYEDDNKDGRESEGLAFGCAGIEFEVQAKKAKKCYIVFSDDKDMSAPDEVFRSQIERLDKLAEESGLKSPVAQQLVMAADAYIVDRDSTGGKTIIAGYPLFSDWGRDTMISLNGCCISAKRFEDAKNILRTFAMYEKDGLMPNVFPEGKNDPMYNTVDASLLFIDGMWQYYKRTNDIEFIKQNFKVMKNIINSYETGTHHAIGMDDDGLIHAGEGYDQVTWMDVRINNILPTPRHGKPVEINAYWYNALCIMDILSGKINEFNSHYKELAVKVRNSFRKKFYIEDKGYLKDVISDTKPDFQIRCNQIWAVSMDFTMLSEDEEKSVVQTVRKHLFNQYGLRSLSPDDEEYHPDYCGFQICRDLAYHQGTTWVFPMGAYYLSYLKVNKYSQSAVEEVQSQLENIKFMLREGCAGQLPEIYDGDNPREGKGCFAQAWSVGEILRVYEKLEECE